jgi:hypothetical protein
MILIRFLMGSVFFLKRIVHVVPFSVDNGRVWIGEGR